MRPSRRARLLWGLFACVMLAACCLAPLPLAMDPDPSGPGAQAARSAQVLGRLLALTGALAAGGWAALPILFGRGGRAVRRLTWSADGTWRLQSAEGSWQKAELLPATATLGLGGGWAILLVWRVERSPRAAVAPAQARGRRRGPPRYAPNRRYALIDVWSAGVPAFRSLRGRLKLEAGAARRRIAF